MFHVSSFLWKGEFENITVRPQAAITKETSDPPSSASC